MNPWLEADLVHRSGVRGDRAAWILGLAAVAVFAPALWWGLPYATGPATIRGWDMDAVAGVSTLAELANLFGQPKADWYVAYPEWHYLLLGGLYAPVMAYLKVTGGLGTPNGQYPFGFTDPVTALAALAFVGRLLTLAMAVGCVVTVYLVAKRVWDRTAGVASALALMLAEPVVFYARTGNLDLPTLFWTVLGLAVSAGIATEGYSVRRGVLLGLCAAAAVGTKDQAYGAFVPLLIVLAVVAVLRPLDKPGTARFRGPLATVFSGALAYAVTSGFVFSPARFVAHVRYVTGFEKNFYNVQHSEEVLRPAGPGGWALLTQDTAGAAAEALGPILVLLGAVGLVLAWRRNRVFALALLATMVGSVALVVFPVRHMQYRYILVPVCVLALAAGLTIAEGVRRGGRTRLATMAIAAAGLLWIGARAADLTWQMLRDARIGAGAWLAPRVQQGDRMGYFGAAHQLPRMPRGLEPLRLGDGADAGAALRQAMPRWVYVAPDYFADRAGVRSTFLPEALYDGLRDGSLGYVRVAYFPRRSLWGRRIRDLPYLNPQVQIFVRTAPR